MKETSIERIEIGGKEYSLFLNRKGLVSWETFSAEENDRIREASSKYANLLSKKDAVITNDTNPFEGLKDVEADDEATSSSFRKLYWIMLYTYHKLSFEEASRLYDEAVEEYGEEQLGKLAVQMIEDININKMKDNQSLKKLSALRPAKN